MCSLTHSTWLNETPLCSVFGRYGSPHLGPRRAAIQVRGRKGCVEREEGVYVRTTLLAQGFH